MDQLAADTHEILMGLKPWPGCPWTAADRARADGIRARLEAFQESRRRGPDPKGRPPEPGDIFWHRAFHCLFAFGGLCVLAFLAAAVSR